MSRWVLVLNIEYWPWLFFNEDFDVGNMIGICRSRN